MNCKLTDSTSLSIYRWQNEDIKIKLLGLRKELKGSSTARN